MSTTTRRQFLDNGAKAAIAGTVIFASADSPKQKQMENIFIHHVYFWLNNPGSTADRDKLVEGLHKLSKVKLLQQFHIGQPAATNRDVVENTYAISWFTVFANAADQASYQTDPIHLKFVEDYKYLWKKVIVYDSVDL
jgi:Stress responsive A/B Barrel Domain